MSMPFALLTCYCLFTGLSYFIIMIYYSKGLNLLNAPPIRQLKPSTFITVVVCFRNEERNLSQLLKSLVEQNYPMNLFEIVLYNDASKDGSLAIIKNCVIRYTNHQIICKDAPTYHGANSAKKLALMDAAINSHAELIVVTDADCVLHPDWLSIIEQSYKQEDALMITGPVSIVKEKGWFNELQFIELQSLAAVSAGAIGMNSPIMCNGANMAFNRITFLALDPYKNNLHIGSGDDMFLLMAMHETHAQQIKFLAHTSAVVYTKGKESLKEYINQRVRWASKSKNYAYGSVKYVALLVLNCNMALLFSPLFIFNGSFLYALILIFCLYGIKQLADTMILFKFSKRTAIKVNYLNLFIFQYIEALLTIIVAMKSIKGTYIWKDRKQYY